jgi:hypothetical protein
LFVLINSLEKSTTVSIGENPYRKHLLQLINNPEFADITLLIEGQKVFAHKTMLAGTILHLSKN